MCEGVCGRSVGDLGMYWRLRRNCCAELAKGHCAWQGVFVVEDRGIVYRMPKVVSI